jgi:hypothetical protein
MKHKPILKTIFFLFWATTAWSQQKEGEIISLCDSIGVEIDPAERDRYHLFPDISGFQSAQIIQLPGSKYRLNYTYQDTVGLHQKSIPMSADALELTRLHIQLTDSYLRMRYAKTINENLEAEMLYRLALKYASQARYDVSSKLIGDLITDYPQSKEAFKAKPFHVTAEKLWKTKKALFWKGSLLDQSGRTDILIFSGYYGLWLGVATPIFFEADSPQAYAAGLLLGAPLSLLLTHNASKEANVSDGRATMISLGGHLGTWQGIGWAAIADLDGSKVIGIGELGGLAGIAAATILTNKIDFSTGHAGLTSSGLQWGAWFGLVFAILVDHEEDDVLRDMLIGSDLSIFGTALATKDVQMSKARVRLINLAGVIGTVLGFGIDLLVEVDDASAAFAIAGLGSVAGLVAGTQMTRNFDRGKDLTLFDMNKSRFCYSFNKGESLWSIAPNIKLQQHPNDKRRIVPAIGLQVNF